MRSAYRAAEQSDLKAANLGVRLVRNADGGIQATVTADETARRENADGRLLIAFYSWGGNTRGIAREIQRQTGADLFEITLVNPYSTSYNTVLMEAQADQHDQTRPAIAKLAPESVIGEGLSVHYSGGVSLPDDVSAWLDENGITRK